MSDVIVMIGVSNWTHPSFKFWLDICRIVSGIHTPWNHGFSMSLTIGRWLNKISQRWYLLGRTSSEVFVVLIVVLLHCCLSDIGCCSSFIAVFVMLFFIHCFLTSCLTLPWAITGFLHPFYTFSPAHRSVIGNIFILTFRDPFFTVLSRALRFWVDIF